MTAVDVDALDALAAVLDDTATGLWMGQHGPGWGRVIAAALLPVVDRIAKERAADEIRAIAHRLDDGGEESAAVTREGAAYVHRVLCDTAHTLDGKP